jgi:Flp pilus assembly protein TadG
MRRRVFRRDERGAAVVEAAFVLPVVIALLFGMLEFGLYFKDNLTVSEAVKDGAHVGAEYAQDPGADYYILQAILHASLNGIVQEVIVYDAGAVNPASQSAQNVPAGCLLSANGVSVGYTDNNNVLHNTGAIGSCNVYIGSQGDFTHVLTDFTNGTFTNSTHWPGSSRLQSTTDVRYTSSGALGPCTIAATSGCGPDFIGVWIKTTHNWMTGFVSTSPSTITDQAVFRIEPRQ